MNICLFFVLFSLAEAGGGEDEYEDWWPRSGIQPNKLVSLVNVRNNCSLMMMNNTYPREYKFLLSKSDLLKAIS